MATPPTIDRPKYESYHFERERVRASRAATIPVILTDRSLDRSWEASLKRQELRELFVVTGLDRQDEDFARHSENSLTDDGLRQWLAEAPTLAIADVAAGLLGRSASVPVDRLAIATPRAPDDDPPFPGDAVLDAAALPATGPRQIEASAVDGRQPRIGERPSRIGIVGETGRAEGVFVAPNVILTPSDVVGDRGLVDIEDAPGHLALGLVTAVDRSLGLALVQAPLSGRPLAIGEAPSERLVRPATSSASRNRLGAPLLMAGRLVGFRTPSGPDIDADAIRIFLDRQRHLLAGGR